MDTLQLDDNMNQTIRFWELRCPLFSPKFSSKSLGFRSTFVIKLFKLGKKLIKTVKKMFLCACTEIYFQSPLSSKFDKAKRKLFLILLYCAWIDSIRIKDWPNFWNLCLICIRFSKYQLIAHQNKSIIFQLPKTKPDWNKS